jgi:AcrR family transcriptional regulator
MSKSEHKGDNVAYHHGNLRAALIDAALARLSAQAEETFSLRELAKGVGVSIAAVYRHFPDKDSLLAELAVGGFEQLVAEWQRRLPKPGKVSAEARFQRLGELYVEFALASPAHYRLMFLQGDLRRFPDLQAAAARCFEFVLATARDAVQEAGAHDRWAMATAGAAWSLVHGYVMLTLGGRLLQGDGMPLTPGLLPRFLQLPKEAL